MAVWARQVRALNIGTLVRSRFGGNSAVGEVPPAGVTAPNVTRTLVRVLYLTKAIIGTSYIIICHDVKSTKKHCVNTINRTGAEVAAREAQSKIANVRILS